MLLAFADRLTQVARRSDFVARYGGDEFVLVLTDTTDPQPVLRRLFALVEEADIEHERSPHRRVTISCGCSVFPAGSSVEPEQMLRSADRALYRAKRAGRNRFVVSLAVQMPSVEGPA